MNRSIALLPLALAACVPAVRMPPPPTPAPVSRAAVPVPVVAAPALGPDWRDWPVTPGSWRYRRDAGGTAALFGVLGAEPLLTLRCDRGARRMVLSRTGASPTPMTLRTSSTARTLPAEGAPAGAAAALAPTDPLLDAMAFSRGRFVVEQPGRAPLVVPVQAEIGRVTEDCRD